MSCSSVHLLKIPTIARDSQWICDIIPPSPVDEKAFASMGVQYFVGLVETQPATFL